MGALLGVLVLVFWVSSLTKGEGKPGDELTKDYEYVEEAKLPQYGTIFQNQAVRQIDSLMISIPGGSFEMGSNEGVSDENPVHPVKVSGFEIGAFEVTHAQWRAIMGENVSVFKNCWNCPVGKCFLGGCQDLY